MKSKRSGICKGLAVFATSFLLLLLLILTYCYFSQKVTCSLQAIAYYKNWDMGFQSVRKETAALPEFFGNSIPPGRKAEGKQRDAVISLYEKIKSVLAISIENYQIAPKNEVKLTKDEHLKTAQNRMAAARFFSSAVEYCILNDDSASAVRYLKKLQKIMDFEVSAKDRDLLTWRIGYLEIRTAQRVCSTMNLSMHDLFELKAILSRGKDSANRASQDATQKNVDYYRRLRILFDCADIAIAAALQVQKQGNVPTSLTSLIPELSDGEILSDDLSRLFAMETGYDSYMREFIKITSKDNRPMNIPEKVEAPCFVIKIPKK